MSAAKHESRSEKTKGRPKGSVHGIQLKLTLPFEIGPGIPLVLKKVCLQDTVSKTKIRLEEELGILPETYYLSYLDSVPLDDSSKLKEHDIVNGGTLRINVWRIWYDLTRTAITGNVKECLENSPSIIESSNWSRHRAWIALYIAAHHGHHNLVTELLDKTKVQINSTSPIGQSALHAATRMGHWKVLCILVNNGADVRLCNDDDETPLDLSRKYEHKRCENSLKFCHWNLQKHEISQERSQSYDAANARRTASRLEHQLLDSTMCNSLRGTQGQIYLAQMPNPISVATVDKFKREKKLITEKDHVKGHQLDNTEDGKKLDFNYGWFDSHRAQKMIPSGRDILKYSDPSSSQLRARSLTNPGGYKVAFYTPPPPPTSFKSM